MAKTPVCVIGLGLIGGSVMRAATTAGREVFGYNRSIDGADAARADGFDATTDLDEALGKAADTGALIVLAVPMPALAPILRRVRDRAPRCPVTDVTSVKGAVLAEVRAAGLVERFVGGHPMAGTAHSGWHATDARLFVDAPWVLSVDEPVDGQVWTEAMTLALDCGAFVVPALSDTTWPPRRSRTCRIYSPRPWRPRPARYRCRSPWPRARSATARGSRPRHRNWCGRCARPTPPSW